MVIKTDLKQLEKKAYRTVFEDGLTDMILGYFILLFAVIPFAVESIFSFHVCFFIGIFTLTRFIKTYPTLKKGESYGE